MRAALAVAACLVAALALAPTRSLAQAPAPAPTPAVAPDVAPTGGAPSVPVFTMAEVATHNAADDCWIVISGKVYDITGWLPYHPGGEMPLLAQCSRDATAAFNMQHSEDLEPQERLPTYYVGDLVMP